MNIHDFRSTTDILLVRRVRRLEVTAYLFFACWAIDKAGHYLHRAWETFF